MFSDDTLVRRTDNKKFKVIFISHWSDIVAEDGSERDNVKWYGNDTAGSLYIGNRTGFLYHIAKETK